MFLSDSHSDGTHSLQSNFIFNFSKTSEDVKIHNYFVFIYIKKEIKNLYMLSKLKKALTFIVVIIV